MQVATHDLDNPEFPQDHTEPAASAWSLQVGNARGDARKCRSGVTGLLRNQPLQAKLGPDEELAFWRRRGDSACDVFAFDMQGHGACEIPFGGRQIATRLERMPEQAQVTTGS